VRASRRTGRAWRRRPSDSTSEGTVLTFGRRGRTLRAIRGCYASFTPQREYARQFGARDNGNLNRRYNVAPSQAVLVARNSEWGDYRDLAILYSGLVAPWAKGFRSARKMINAWAETARIGRLLGWDR